MGIYLVMMENYLSSNLFTKGWIAKGSSNTDHLPWNYEIPLQSWPMFSPLICLGLKSVATTSPRFISHPLPLLSSSVNTMLANWLNEYTCSIAKTTRPSKLVEANYAAAMYKCQKQLPSPVVSLILQNWSRLYGIGLYIPLLAELTPLIIRDQLGEFTKYIVGSSGFHKSTWVWAGNINILPVIFDRSSGSIHWLLSKTISASKVIDSSPEIQMSSIHHPHWIRQGRRTVIKYPKIPARPKSFKSCRHPSRSLYDSWESLRHTMAMGRDHMEKGHWWPSRCRKTPICKTVN